MEERQRVSKSRCFCSICIVILLKGVFIHLPFGYILILLFIVACQISLYVQRLNTNSYGRHVFQSYVLGILNSHRFLLFCNKQCKVCVYRHQWFTDHIGGSRLFSDKNRCRNRSWSLGFPMQ